MAIGSDYSAPVSVNGFSCKNCTDVDYAKKHIDPAHPRSGPYGINAKDDPTVKNDPSAAVTFGGNLRGLNDKQLTAASQGPAQPPSGEAVTKTATGVTIGTQLDLTA